MPGFIDAHMHLETVKLMVDEFARLVLPLGTTAVVADPHEIANVLGVDGVHWLLDASAGLQLDVFFMAPSCVPASPFESPRRPLSPGDLESLMRRRRVLGLAEMMNYPGVIAGSPSELEKLTLEGAEHVDGHAPGVIGKELQAYAAAGIASDHEALTVEEGRERLRAGMWLLIREASMARNLLALLPLVRELGPGRIAFCTDDRDPEDIADDGHVNGMVREAVAAGIAPRGRARHGVASIPPSGTGCDRHGAIAPGYQADLLVLPDLESFVPELVLKRGRPIEETPRSTSPTGCDRRVRIKPVAASRLRDPRFGQRDPRDRADPRPGRDRVARLRAGRRRTAPPSPTAERDLAKIAVVERHLATGRIGLGFVAGSGLQRGALASTVAHDAHNLVVVGMSDSDMAFAVERLAEIGGGIVAVDGGRVLAECPLPIAGLLSDAPLADVIDAEPGVQRRRTRARVDRRHAVPHALLPRPLGDPAPEDHRSRPRRRRPLRARPARGVTRLYANGWIVTCDDAARSTRPAGCSSRTTRSSRPGQEPSRRPTSASISAAPSSRPASSTPITTCTRR